MKKGNDFENEIIKPYLRPQPLVDKPLLPEDYFSQAEKDETRAQDQLVKMMKKKKPFAIEASKKFEPSIEDRIDDSDESDRDESKNSKP